MGASQPHHDGSIDSGPQLKAAFGGAYIANEKMTLASAKRLLADGVADAVAFGIPFIANPDLPERFRQGVPLNEPDPATFYAPGPRGYTDYPFLPSPPHEGAA